MADDRYPSAAWWPSCRIAEVPPGGPPPQAEFESPLAALGYILLRLYPLALEAAISEFEPRLFHLLHEVIAFDAGWTGRAALTAENGPVLHNSCLYELPVEKVVDWERLKHDDPVVMSYLGGGSAKAVAVVVAETAMTGDFRAYAAKYSLMQALACFAKDPTLGLHSFLSIYRKSLDRPFTAADEAFMEALIPHVASATNINRVHQIAQIKAGAAGSRVAVGISDALGILQFADSGFADFMISEWPNWKGPRLPPELSLAASSDNDGHFTGSRIVGEVRSAAELRVIQLRPRSIASSLTPKEQAVTRLFAEGLTYKEVARRLDVAPATVKHHLRNAYAKLGVKDKGKIAWLLGQENEGSPGDGPRQEPRK